MSRAKGTPKTGGRQAGTPNKVTETLKEYVINLLDDNREQIAEDIKALRPKDRLAVLERFMQYVIPKQQAVSADLGGTDNLLEHLYIERLYVPNAKSYISHNEEEIDMTPWKKDANSQG